MGCMPKRVGRRFLPRKSAALASAVRYVSASTDVTFTIEHLPVPQRFDVVLALRPIQLPRNL